jgi:hypothetical protein
VLGTCDRWLVLVIVFVFVIVFLFLGGTDKQNEARRVFVPAESMGQLDSRSPGRFWR